MGHASEYSHKPVSAEKAVGAQYGITPASRPAGTTSSGSARTNRTAAVTLKPTATASTGELRAFVKDRVAPYKYPRYVWIRPDLPKGPTGKILRREVSPPQDLRQG